MSRAEWTPERVEILKRMWGEGKSAAEIARELGGITRNTVIGKVHRLGLGAKNRSSSAALSVKVKSPHSVEAGTSQSEGAGNARNSWTREEEDMLLKLKASGKPFPVVTGELNQRFPNRTKPFMVAPVTAKYYYLLKQGRVAPQGEGGVKQAVVRASIRSVDFTQIFTTEADHERRERVKALEEAARRRPGKRITIMELTQKTCHWPIGDPNEADFHFCGLPVGTRTNGKLSSYCEAHTALSYIPAREYRQRQRRS